MDYEQANKYAEEGIRGCIIIGTLFVLAALYMIWFGGAV